MQTEAAMFELLKHSFLMCKRDENISKLEFLSDYVFNFTTYDSSMSNLFAIKALEVCVAINDGDTFEYIKNAENYRWFLLMCNMPFFVPRLEWGGSIRGAWWDGAQKLESCGIWGKDEQLLSMDFSEDEWKNFIRALIVFSTDWEGR